MNRKTLVRLATEAGFEANEFGSLGDGYWQFDAELTKFAELVAAEERERCALIAELGDDGEWSKSTGDYDACRGRDIARAIRSGVAAGGV